MFHVIQTGKARQIRNHSTIPNARDTPRDLPIRLRLIDVVLLPLGAGLSGFLLSLFERRDSAIDFTRVSQR